MDKKYRLTTAACYVAYCSHASIINLMPLLFIPLREQFGFSYTQLGALVLVNFATQLAVDILLSFVVDRWGFRKIAVAGHLLIAAGLITLAMAPVLPFTTYSALVLATLLYSTGGGALEVIISPIINAIPAEDKSSNMSLLHSFYCWGTVAVVLLTTLFLFGFGKEHWPVITALWAILPIANTFIFAACPLAPPVPEDKKTKARSLWSEPVFFVLLLTIMFGGAAEITIMQWTSAYMEVVFEFPKVVGDCAGMCMFAVMMGIGRAGYGILGSKRKLNLHAIMIAGASLAVVCYLIVALSPVPLFGLVMCVACGLGVSLLWPGALSLSVDRFPLAGAWMFAIMAAAGDTGASVGPWIAGMVADRDGLRTAILVGTIFPLCALTCLLVLLLKKKKA
ncbi:MAG: MFS transporter [Defluviitaleaceae bacterium]|nr:MFS transporter [Defluviitaleaceae bacterium]